jgi:hypothetical protein
MTDRAPYVPTSDALTVIGDPTDDGEAEPLEGPIRLSQYGGNDFALPPPDSGPPDGEKQGHRGDPLPDPPENRLRVAETPFKAEPISSGTPITKAAGESEDPSEKLKVKIPRSSSDHL